MPAENLKQLYMGKCLDDLKSRFEIKPDADSKRLCRAAPKLFKAGEKARLTGDEELGYVYYMKFLSVVHLVKNNRKTSGRKENDGGDIRNQDIKDALDYAEKLSASLQNRYKEQEETEVRIVNKLKDLEIAEKVVSAPVKPQPTENINGFADVSSEFISCEKLYSLLDRKKKLLIMDVRSESSYSDSRMKTECVVNVPDTVVKAGMTAPKLEKVLPLSSKSLWTQRGIVDLVILVDWSSCVKNLKQESSVSVLRDILLKWDSEVVYKSNPLILEGGFEEWLLRYPVCTTNANPKHLPCSENLLTADFLDDIEYPNLSESPETKHPSIDRSSKPSLNLSHSSVPVSNTGTFSKCVIPKSNKPLPSNTFASVSSKPTSLTKNTSSSAPVSSRPSIDRKSKAAAMITYEEHSKKVQELLRQEEEVVTASLKLEQNRQIIEEEREKIRMRREMEAEEEMRIQLQEREEQLLKDIQHLVQQQQEKEKENQTLRDRLAEYEKRDQEENSPKDSIYKQEEEAIAARIRSSEEKRKKIVQDRERKAQEHQIQKKKMGEDNAHNNQTNQNLLSYKEREKQAREKLHQDRLLRERLKQGRTDEEMLKDKGRQESDDKDNRPSVHSKIPCDADRDRKKGTDAGNEQNQAFKNKINDTYTTTLKDTPSGIMMRAHSSPNIAQLNDSELIAKGKPFKSNFVPEIRINRQRNFSPVYGDLGRGLTGLKNLGNTCYMNSIIQCLSNTTPLARYFVSGDYRNDINRQTETRGEIAEEVAAVVRAIWSTNYKCIATRDLRSAVGKHRDQFQTTQQQDSNEFLTILMDWLHEDLKKPSMKIANDTGRDQCDWEKQWNEFYKENSSLIVLLFYGQQKSTVHCLKCNKESVRYETFSNLTLPLPCNSSSCTLEECVQLYVKGERITGWKCPACKEQRDAMKKFDIIKLPPILIVHFKRFYIDGWCRKRQTFVQFPLRDWDMRKFTLLPEQKYTKYNLYGVSNHYGTMEGGHYTAYCKSIDHKKWYKFDDNEVSEISPSEVQSGAAYILFYASINFNVPDVS